MATEYTPTAEDKMKVTEPSESYVDVLTAKYMPAVVFAAGALLPTEDPAVVGALWNNSGNVSVSAG